MKKIIEKSFLDSAGIIKKSLTLSTKIETAVEMICDCIRNGHVVYLFGNGGNFTLLLSSFSFLYSRKPWTTNPTIIPRTIKTAKIVNVLCSIYNIKRNKLKWKWIIGTN